MPEAAILDTNVLLLWLAGKLDISLFSSWKRVQVFEPSDYELLTTLLGRYRHICTTPHILSEASNFVDQAPRYRRSDLVDELRQFIAASREHYETAISLADLDDFALLGLTDAGLVSLSKRNTVVTTDFHLDGRITKNGGFSVNLNHFRSERLLRT